MSTGYSSIEEIEEKYEDKINDWEKGYEEEGIYNTDDVDKLLLCIVAYEDDFEAVKFLIQHGVDPNDDYNFRTPLHYAVRNGNFKIVRYLIEKCDGDVNDETGNKYYGDNYPTLALAYDPKIAKYLIDRGAREVIPSILGSFLWSYGISGQVKEYTMKLLKEAIKKKLAEKKSEDDDDEESILYSIEFKDEETAKRMFDELIPTIELEGVQDNIIEIWYEELEDEKFQEIADKYKVEFKVYYKPVDEFGDPLEQYTKEFKPK